MPISYAVNMQYFDTGACDSLQRSSHLFHTHSKECHTSTIPPCGVLLCQQRRYEEDNFTGRTGAQPLGLGTFTFILEQF